MSDKAKLDGDLMHRCANLLENRATGFVTHLREIANNISYQCHKGILKARLREIEKIRDSLEIIEEELKTALGEEKADAK